MVANTNTKTTTTFIPTNSSFYPSFKMDLPANLLHPIILWKKDDVQKWIEYCMDEYSLQDINLNDFEMNGKALLLLNEDSFKQRSPRSGDILFKALQQHNALVKSFNCQNFPYQFYGSFGLPPQSTMRHFNIPLPSLPLPLPMPYMHPTFNYMYPGPEKRTTTNFINSHQPARTQQTFNSSSSSVIKPLEQNNPSLPMPSIKQECIDHKAVNIEQHEKISCQLKTSNSQLIPQQLKESKPIKIHSELYSRIKQEPNEVINMNEDDTTKKIRYYHDRVDFHGDILMKPPAAKNCRILWEFLYILLEDPCYESIIHWENREKMIFRIVQAEKLAALWGLQKNRLSMTYEKLSRGMRYYYSNNIISKEQSKRLLYRFMRSPDEIRKTMKRTSDTTNTVYSTIHKKPSLPLSSTRKNHTPESSDQMSNRFLELFSVHSPTCPSMVSNSNSGNNLLFTTPNDSISKSDRSSSSSPVSFDSNHDSEKQYRALLQPSSSLTLTKHKHTYPIPLNTRLSRNYSFEQPLNLVVQKEEENLFNYKKQRLIYSQPNIG